MVEHTIIACLTHLELASKFENKELKEKVSVYVKDRDPYLKVTFFKNSVYFFMFPIMPAENTMYISKVAIKVIM